MTDIIYLGYIIDPFAIHEPFFAITSSFTKNEHINITEVAALKGKIISYNITDIVREFSRKQVTIPDGLIDVGLAIRLLSGIPKDEGGSKDWDVWRKLSEKSNLPASIKSLENISQGSEPFPSSENVDLFLAEVLNALPLVWLEVDSRLNEEKQFDRFHEIEMPVNKIFQNRLYCGVPIDRDTLLNFKAKAQDKKYKAYKVIAETLQISSSGLNYRNVGEYLDRTDAAHLKDHAKSPSFEEYFKLASYHSSFAKSFIDFMDANKSSRILSRLSSGEKRVFPSFLTFGTVTGRILIEDPYLQQLKRAYRGVITADPGNNLLYLDYSQFEPGILASLSKDEKLISDYNETDLYVALSNRLFGVPTERKTCKRIFLSFCYGMSKDRIAQLVVGTNVSDSKSLALATKVSEFFDQYKKLDAYKKTLEQFLFENGFISSINGNRRYRKESGPLTSKEKRWAISQSVQGTASLIFKDALTKLAEAFGYDAILLPLHDAVLLQFKDDEFDSKKDLAKQIMARSFVDYCPDIKPKISDSDFAENDTFEIAV